jgi:nitrate reductase cytochrome c-type subunit
MGMRRLVTIPAALVLAACTSSSERREAGTPAAPAAISDTQLGLARGSVFDTAAPPLFAVTGGDPGENAVLQRMNAEAPPLVPHAVGDFLPIMLDANACVDCHAVAEREAGGPVPLPASHFVDLRNAPGERRDSVAGARWVCTSCHVVQTDAPALVRNTAGT